MANQKKAEIRLEISLDENKVPETINWSAEDGGIVDKETKAVLLSVWDAEDRETLRIDLWTKDMPLDDMKVFFFQTLHRMADTYLRATNDTELADKMRNFSEYVRDRISPS